MSKCKNLQNVKSDDLLRSCIGLELLMTQSENHMLLMESHKPTQYVWSAIMCLPD